MTFQSASQPQNLQQALAAFPSGIHFVSGIDTDAGKTVCTGWLARELMRAGRRVITMKLVQTGCDSVSPDLELHRRMTGVHFPEDEEGLTAPALFHHPASPHLAAELDGRTVEPEMLADCARRLAERYDIVLASLCDFGRRARPASRRFRTGHAAVDGRYPLRSVNELLS